MPLLHRYYGKKPKYEGKEGSHVQHEKNLVCSARSLFLARRNTICANDGASRRVRRGIVSEEPVVMTLDWANIDRYAIELSIPSGVATCFVQVIGRPGTTRISATLMLQRRNPNGTWNIIRTWSNQVNSSIMTLSGTEPVAAGTYRLRCSITVTRNGVNETVMIYSAERTR